MIDKELVRERFRRSVVTYDNAAEVQRKIINQLVSYLPSVASHVFEIGCGTGLLTEQLCSLYGKETLVINDLVEEMCQKTRERCNIELQQILCGDAEQLEFPDNLDLVVSASTFQWFNSPEDVYNRLLGVMQSNGLFVFSSFGDKNLKEIKALTLENGLSDKTLDQNKVELSKYFTVLKAEERFYTLDFSSPECVLRHIKATGVNGIHRNSIWTKGKITRFSSDYIRIFGQKASVPLTYHVLYFVCQKK